MTGCQEDIDARRQNAYHATATMLYALSSTEMKSIDRHEEASEKINRWVEKIILEMTALSGFTLDVSSDLLRKSQEKSSEVVERLLEEFGSTHNHGQIDSRSKKRQRSDNNVPDSSSNSAEPPVDQHCNASEQNIGEDSWGDNLINDSVSSPLAESTDEVPTVFENQRQRQLSAEAAIEPATYSIPQRHDGGNSYDHRFDLEARFNPPSASVASAPATSQDYASNDSGCSSEMATTSVSSYLSLRESEAATIAIMQNNLNKYGITAGNPRLLHAIRVNIERSIADGDLDAILKLGVPIVRLFHAKTTSAMAYNTQKQLKATRVMQSVVETAAWDEISCGEFLSRLENTVSYEDIPSTEWTRIRDAIQRHNDNLDERIKPEKYYSVSRGLKNQGVIFFYLCLIINAMSVYNLREFADTDLLLLVRRVYEGILPNERVDAKEMTVKQLIENVLVPALKSKDESLIATAVHMACEMWEQMRDEALLRPKFEAGQQMRLDGKGRCNGNVFKLNVRYSDLLNLLFCLVLGPQIQSEFRPGFFDVHGSFNSTILRASWSDIERKCNKFPKQEFFTSLFPSRYNKVEAIQRMEEIIRKGKDADERIPIVIFDEGQMKCLKQINQAAFK